jgi:hypothetical protein
MNELDDKKLNRLFDKEIMLTQNLTEKNAEKKHQK